MAFQHADQVRALLDAVRDGAGELAVGFFLPEIVHHDPHTAADGAAFREHLKTLANRRPDIELVRILEDGEFVVAQLRSEKAAQDRFTVYRFEGVKVAEQWAFYSGTTAPNRSGHTQLDGPTQPQHLDDTESNKAFVREYYETFHLRRDQSRNGEFFTEDVMIRHEPGVQDGLTNFLQDVEHLMQHRTIDAIKLLIGQGDLVFVAAAGTHEGKACAYIDLYRVKDRKVVEHWGFPQMIPAVSEAANATALL